MNVFKNFCEFVKLNITRDLSDIFEPVIESKSGSHIFFEVFSILNHFQY